MQVDERALSSLLRDDAQLRCVEPHIYSVLRAREETNVFDRIALFYDVVICNPTYNRLVWGYSVQDYQPLMREALGASKEGWVLDCGCGSLAFTAGMYVRYADRPVVLLDQSLELLKIAKSRLVKLKGSFPRHVILLQADALRLPFLPRAFTTIISLNLLHVLPDAAEALRGLRNILADIGGSMAFTTLIRAGRPADRYLAMMLKRAGGRAPRRLEDLRLAFSQAGMRMDFSVQGNMAFISAFKADG